MKKWIILISIGLVILLAAVFGFYSSSLKPLNRAEEWAYETAKNKAGIQEIKDFTIYNGTDTYYIVTGVNSNGAELIVWIPEKEEENIVVLRKSAGITKEEAVQKLYQEKDIQVDEIVHVKLGMENHIPLWEIFYRSNDLINYYYVDFRTGEWLKHIKNL